MGTRLGMLVAAAGVVATLAPVAGAGKYGFADKPGGGKNDPIIEVAGSIGPNQGAVFSVTEDQANDLYQFNSGSGNFQLTQTPPLLPPTANNANQFIRIKFPFKISSAKVRKTIMKPKANLAGNSFLTPKITITDETGLHVPGIATIKGKTVHGTNVKNDPNFPVWLNAKGKNQLVNDKVFTYVADSGDQLLSTIAAFKPDPNNPQTSLAKEIRVRIHEVDGVIINGFWALKVGDGAGNPAPGQAPLQLLSVTPLSPVTPPKTQGGNVVVEAFSKYVVEYTSPVAPWSVGFSAEAVKEENATNPTIPLNYNGNTGPVPNPNDLTNPYFPNFVISASPNGVASFVVPYDVRPINPNNLAQYVVNPLLDLPGKVTVNLTTVQLSNNQNTTPLGTTVGSAVTSLYNEIFNDPDTTRTFATNKGRAFTNVPVSPSALYFLPASGTGAGGINLDGTGFETNDPSTDRIMLLTNNAIMCACPVFLAYVPLPQTSTQINIVNGLMPIIGIAGSFQAGCNGNTFGDATGMAPVGIAGNPPSPPNQLGGGGPTPIPGVNEGSTGSTANKGDPDGIYPPGFETVLRNSDGSTRLADSPLVGNLTDVQVGPFLDTLFFDTLNPFAQSFNHISFLSAGAIESNGVSDPPLPNPPPLRLPVGLPPVDIVFNQQKLLKPAFVIEGDEVWTGCVGCPPPPPTGTCLGPERILLRPGKPGSILGDSLPNYPQVGPIWQTFVGTAPGPNFTGIPYSSRQQIGNFLYVADSDMGGVTVLNSNTFTVIDRISLPDPEGMGLAPDLKALYVSNFSSDTLSIIDTYPFSPNFHTEVNRVNVGSGPRAVSVQPENEDVFVSNYLGNTVSILDVKSQTIRKTLSGSLSRPLEVIPAPRQFAAGYQNLVYMAYIPNQGNGEISIYESGPSGSTGFGADDLRWSVADGTKFQQMSGAAWDPVNYPGSPVNLPGGVFVAHTDAQTGQAMISRVAFTAQLPQAGAFPPVPLPGTILSSPGVVQRTFAVVGFWGGPLMPFQQQLNPGGQSQAPFDIVFSDISTASFHSPVVTQNYKTNLGSQPSPFTTSGGANSKHPQRIGPAGLPVPAFIPDRMYVSFPSDNRISVLDPNVGGAVLNTIEGVPQVGKMAHYFDL